MQQRATVDPVTEPTGHMSLETRTKMITMGFGIMQILKHLEAEGVSVPGTAAVYAVS